MYIVVCVSIGTPIANAQQLMWERVFDPGGTFSNTENVAIDPVGNIILIASRQFGNYLLIKYSATGDTIWLKEYDRTDADGGYGVAVDSSGNIIAVGYITEDSTFYNPHIVKFTPDGDTIWTRTFYGEFREAADYAYDVAVDSKNNILVSGQGQATPASGTDYLVLKYDSAGTLLWNRWYVTEHSVAQDVAVDDSDNVLVTGYSSNGLNYDWCTIKYTPDGDIFWIRRLDLSLEDRARGVATDREGNVFIAGRTVDTTRMRYDGMVIKYSPSGDTLWTKRFTDSSRVTGISDLSGIAVDSAGYSYVTSTYFFVVDSLDGMDYWLTKSDPQGDSIWTFRYDYDYYDQPTAVALDGNGDLVVTGTTVNAPHSYRNKFLTLKIHDITDDLETGSPLPREISLSPNYPNPFNTSTAIEFAIPDERYVTMDIFTILGQKIATLVDERKKPGRYSMQWSAGRCASGTYLIRFRAGSFTETRLSILLR